MLYLFITLRAIRQAFVRVLARPRRPQNGKSGPGARHSHFFKLPKRVYPPSGKPQQGPNKAPTRPQGSPREAPT